MQWKPIAEIPVPEKEWDFDHRKFLLFDGETVVVGRCVLEDREEGRLRFTYDRDGYEIVPTHWMEIPPPPL